MRRPSVRSLHCGEVWSVPRDASWGEGYGETWNFTEAGECPHCGKTTVWGEACQHCGKDTEPSDGPMMNYFYPCDIRDTNEAAVTIACLPLCVVTLETDNGTETGLALTGGGMNLSWEICEAYMLLGALPPFHYASNLPRIAGRGASARDRWILAGCLRSVSGIAECAKLARARLRAVRAGR